ncbi:MAG: 50S ribosomal protein L1 [Candidatus Daviesbacteria bacterium]|nr:50S ribosomal protein L1 [Candidatus Daviesbacteria bacterium]
MGKTKIKNVGEDQVSVLSSQLSDKSPSVVSPSETDEQKTGKPESENRKQKTDNKAKIRGHKYQEAKTKVDQTLKYSLLEAVKLAQETSYSKFPGTIEAHFNTNVKNIRGLISLPHFTGKKLTILAFPSTSSGQVASDLGDDVIIGNDETISQIEAGPSAGSGLKFDVLVTTPAWMPKLAKCAKILGPRSLMPNPKNGTITENLSKTVAELQGGKMEYKTEKDGKVIHLAVGKVNQAPEEISANIKTLFNTIGKSKISKITLSPTMGVGVKVDLSSI